MVLLELVVGRALTSVELCQWAAGEDKGQQAFLLADAALRGEMEGREETLASCLRLGFATRLAAANATAAKASIESALALDAERVPAPASAADADARKGMRSCLQLYAGAVPALRWAARSVAAGRYSGAREVLEAAQYVASGCAGMAGEALGGLLEGLSF